MSETTRGAIMAPETQAGTAEIATAEYREALVTLCETAMRDAMNTFGPFSGRRQAEHIADAVIAHGADQDRITRALAVLPAGRYGRLMADDVETVRAILTGADQETNDPAVEAAWCMDPACYRDAHDHSRRDGYYSD